MSDVGVGPDDFEVEASNGGDMVGLTVVKQLNIEFLHPNDDVMCRDRGNSFTSYMVLTRRDK